MSEITVRISEQDADCLLATVEWALNHGCDGPNEVTLVEYARQIGGRQAVERAARKIESVAAMRRAGIDPDFPTSIVGDIPKPTILQRVRDLLRRRASSGHLA